MAKRLFACTNCNAESPKWVGTCPRCGKVATMEEIEQSSTAQSGKAIGTKTSLNNVKPKKPVYKLSELAAQEHTRINTGMEEVNRVLGGGLVPGGVVLMAGEPGAGKSTLLGHLSKSIASLDKKVLYVSGEESTHQIRLRSERIKAIDDNIFVISEQSVVEAIAHIIDMRPDLVIVDSIQTLASPEETGRAGGVAQVNEVSSLLTKTAKELGIPMVLVGHFTKDGNIAGPRTVEHLVDVVLQLEYTDNSPLRLLRAVKNRYGSVNEVGCFEHVDSGLKEISDPSMLLLGDRADRAETSGVMTCIIMEGIRPIPVEVQALAVTSSLNNPRRVASGLEHQRTLMVEAVCEKHAGVQIMDKDVFVSTVGGVKIKEPGADLALALAIASSSHDAPLSPMAIAIGEVELSGEIRPVSLMGQRIKEASRLGFKEIYAPRGAKKAAAELGVTGLDIFEFRTLSEARNHALSRR